MTRKWVIRYAPRSQSDSRPWFLGCPNEMPEWAWYEQGSWCYCRRFKNGNKAISFYNRRVRGNRIMKEETK